MPMRWAVALEEIPKPRPAVEASWLRAVVRRLSGRRNDQPDRYTKTRRRNTTGHRY